MKTPYVALLISLVACGGAGGTSVATTQAPSAQPTATQVPTATPGPTPSPAAGLTVADGLHIVVLAHVSGARELASLPNGDLLVGTTSSNVYIIPNAESSQGAASPVVFATLNDSLASGVAFDPKSSTVFVGTTHGVYTIPYTTGMTSAANATKIASVRTITDGGHTTTSVAVSNGVLYASVGSSCNACTETDPSRATIQQMSLAGANMTARAVHIRNAIALAVDPSTGDVWAGDAGQDDLPSGHPYEFFDDVSSHAGIADYGWPTCEENHQAYGSGADCTSIVVPLAELPAYSTIIGAAFYPAAQGGTHAFPATLRNGAFLAAHGSWHQTNGIYDAKPQVVFVPMSGGRPAQSVTWSDPTTQWTPFVTGFQLADGVTRIGRPTGIAVGAQGSVFIADDQAGVVYRVRP